MKFFTLAEIFNKISGFVILAIISRNLGVEQFALYASVLVVFGYCIEFASYSYQTKNLFSATESLNDFLYSTSFVLRILITIITSCVAFLFFYNYFPGDFYFHILPIALTLLFSAVTFDYLLYATGNSNYLVVARFIAQSALFINTYLYFSVINIQNECIFVLNFLNSLLLFVLTAFFLYKNKLISVSSFFSSFRKVRINLQSLKCEFASQTPVMLARLFVLMVVTIEVPILVLFKSDQLETVSVSHRIALILLPFLVFYINSKAKEIKLAEFRRVMIFSSIGASVFVIFAPILIYFLFGKEFSGIEEKVTPYFYIIAFQTFVNYVFYFSVKEGLEIKMLYAIAVVTVIFSAALSFICIYKIDYSFIIFTLISLKALFVVVSCDFFNSSDKFFHGMLLLVPSLLSILLSSTGYFETTRVLLHHLTNLVSIPL